MPKGQADGSLPAGGEYNPQNVYNSYMPLRVYKDTKTYNDDMVSHERLSHTENMSRANGNTLSLDTMTNSLGDFQSDGK